MKLISLFIISMLSISCNSQDKKVDADKLADIVGDDNLQIGQYVKGGYEDLKGSLWFGTIQKRIAKKDGKEFHNYNVPISIMGMMNARKGDIWLGGACGL
jgi:hypothetical protein